VEASRPGRAVEASLPASGVRGVRRRSLLWRAGARQRPLVGLATTGMEARHSEGGIENTDDSRQHNKTDLILMQ
jgi:hypothetical protein